MPTATRWQDWMSFGLGLWLAVSPWLWGYNDRFAPTASAALSGLLLALVAHFEAACCEDSTEWVNLGLGLWLLAAPFVVGFNAMSAAGMSSIVTGALVAALAAFALGLPGRTRAGL